MHTDVGIGAGPCVVANGAGIRGVAGLNATIRVENRAGEVCINDFDGASEVWMDAQVCALGTRGDRVATELAISNNVLAREILRMQLNDATK